MRQSLYAYCRQYRKLPLLDEWDVARNLPLTPQTVTYGSKRAVWWRCEKGHSWRAAVRSRTVGSGCPICAGKQLSIGENDLAALYPALAKQWDAEKNGRLTPRDVLPGAEKKVWWRCERGHSYPAVIASRTNGSGCPYCTGKRCWRASTILQPWNRRSPPNGTRRSTARSPRRW